MAAAPSMSDWREALVEEGSVARLATVDEGGRPHVVPIVYAYDGERLYTPLDEKPKRVGPYELRRARNVAKEPRVAVVVDRYREDWEALAWVQLRGRAQIVASGPEHAQGVKLLLAKYPQYEDMPLHGRPLIVVAIEERVGWRASEPV